MVGKISKAGRGIIPPRYASDDIFGIQDSSDVGDPNQYSNLHGCSLAKPRRASVLLVAHSALGSIYTDYRMIYEAIQ